ncbi:MAG: four helix bundle protein [Candidatus Symbiothrix sp.]|jgi:four helix bundle protein|nr:four helix bundle protein [Candidatus Symbiothrix sp.]
MKENVLRDKSYDFALRVINAYKFLNKEQKEFVLSKQLLRSGTAIGALVREAEYAQSVPDFINKLSVALKEANETEYWFMLLKDSDYISENVYLSIINNCQELIRLLISSIKTAKQKIVH